MEISGLQSRDYWLAHSISCQVLDASQTFEITEANKSRTIPATGFGSDSDKEFGPTEDPDEPAPIETNAEAEYATFKELQHHGVTQAQLKRLRNSEKIRHKMIGNAWYHHRKDVERELDFHALGGRQVTPQEFMRGVKSYASENLESYLYGFSTRSELEDWGFKGSTLRRLREQGKIRGRKYKNTWYYLLADVERVLN